MKIRQKGNKRERERGRGRKRQREKERETEKEERNIVESFRKRDTEIEKERS